MSEKTIIFYSGKLWHSDKPFPVKPDSKDYTVSALYQADTNYYHNNILPAWLSTAYEVVNPELMPGIYEYDGSVYYLSQEEMPKELKDGDQITLPEGYGIKNNLQWHPVGCEGKWQNTNEYYFDTVQFPCGKRRAATITLPEKPDNSAHGDTAGVVTDVAPTTTVSVRSLSVEPSESQEEMPAVPWRIEEKPKGWGDVTVMFDANDNCIMYERSPSIQAWRIIVNAVNEKFHITRRKPF